MKQNIKYILGALGLFVAGGIFATAILSTVNTKEAEATLKDDIYRYAGVTTTTTEAQPEATTAQAQQQTATPQNSNGVSVAAIAKGNPWTEGDLTLQEIEFNIYNNGTSEVNSWTGAIQFNTEVRGINSWNDNFSFDGSTVLISPAEWNNVIKPKEKKTLNFHLKTSAAAQVKNASVSTNLGNIQMSEQTQAQTQPVTIDTTNSSTTPLAQHGKLSVNGTQIVDSSGKPVILQGVSTHGIGWFPAYVNKDAFQTLRDTMGVNTIRLALYSSDGEAYSTALHQKVVDGVNYAKELGMYAIIDWHILQNGNPNTDKERAKAFFNEMTDKFKDYDNVIYEICNEPNGNVTWENDIKPYANEMINLIRSKDNDAIIIVGTPTWSQDVDIVAQSPLTGHSNIMYALHFYAATHRQDLRNKLDTAYQKGLPVIVSEFGISEASGAGGIDEGEASTWVSHLRNKGISYVCWNLSNKNEACALLKSDCTKTSGWTDSDLTQSGLWVKKTYTNK